MGDTGQAFEIPFKHGTKDCVLHKEVKIVQYRPIRPKKFVPITKPVPKTSKNVLV